MWLSPATVTAFRLVCALRPSIFCSGALIFYSSGPQPPGSRPVTVLGPFGTQLDRKKNINTKPLFMMSLPFEKDDIKETHGMKSDYEARGVNGYSLKLFKLILSVFMCFSSP